MKLSHLGQYSGKRSSLLKEALGDLDNNAKLELDGPDELGPDELELGDTEDIVDVEDVPEPPKSIAAQGYSLQNVADQLNGMIDKWFKLAAEMPPEKKQNFLKLGDRLDEIVNVLQSEFM